jgi:hypothetical protein
MEKNAAVSGPEAPRRITRKRSIRLSKPLPVVPALSPCVWGTNRYVGLRRGGIRFFMSCTYAVDAVKEFTEKIIAGKKTQRESV